jgi:hypothetical protein
MRPGFKKSKRKTRVRKLFVDNIEVYQMACMYQFTSCIEVRSARRTKQRPVHRPFGEIWNFYKEQKSWMQVVQPPHWNSEK